jgi:hypothetical protein
MSKAEMLQQLKSLSPSELDEVADRIDELRDDANQIPAEHRIILEERLASYHGSPDQGEDAAVVVERILSSLKSEPKGH